MGRPARPCARPSIRRPIKTILSTATALAPTSRLQFTVDVSDFLDAFASQAYALHVTGAAPTQFDLTVHVARRGRRVPGVASDGDYDAVAKAMNG